MEINVKALMIVALFLTSIAMMSSLAYAEEEDDGGGGDKEDVYENYQKNFGSSFGEFGYGGEVFERVFTMLLYEGLELEDKAITEGVYVLSAEDDEDYDGEWDFEEEDDETEVYTLPWIDEDEDDINDYNMTIGSVDVVDEEGYIYCLVEKDGGFDYELTVGAALTLLIWDYDKSFIEAAQKVIDVIAKVDEEKKEKGKVSDETIEEAVEVITWLIIHINEIFTGDELFVFNPITWQTVEIDPWDGSEEDQDAMEITKTWYYSDDEELDAEDDNVINDADILDDWNKTAKAKKDFYMQWLLTDDGTLQKTTWTEFTFDLAQLWVKNFYVEIDVGELSKGEDAEMEKLINDLDIEFLLFTHHLIGPFLYDDEDDNDIISMEYVDWEEKDYDIPIEIDEDEAQVPDTSELTHRLYLGGFDDPDEGFDFDEPEVGENNEVSWGLNLKDVGLTPVPIGVDLDSYLTGNEEELEFIEFKLNFIPELKENEKGEIEASSDVKLETNFAPWSGSDDTHTNITGLDLSLIYVSTILYFHLEIKNKEKVTDPKEDDYIDEGDFEDFDDEIKVGNYLSEKAKDELDFIDLAGEDYLIGDDKDSADKEEPTTSIIPLGLWEGEYERHMTEIDEDDGLTIYNTDIEAEAEFNVMLYAVCYPEFDGSRDGVWHDPTFSVYMIFTPESAGFWGLILLIAGVGLAGVATILIKRRKDKKY